jgi:amino acid transporter
MTRTHDVVAPPAGFRRLSLTGWGLFFFAVSASAPMTVLIGGIVGAFAVTGVAQVPAAFVLLTALLLLVWVGHVGMARHVRHSGPLYAHVAQGLGAVPALGAVPVVLLAYNAIQGCLFGLLGQTLSDFGLGPWWVWGLIAWAAMALLGLGQVTVTARMLAFLLGIELVVVGTFAVFGVADATSLSLAPLSVTSMFGQDGVGSVLALTVACFVGAETTLAFAEEAVSHKTLVRASFGSLVFLGLLYTLAAWAVTAVTGAGNVGPAAASDGVNIVFNVVADHLGLLGVILAEMFLVTSIFAAGLSFHQTISRYVFTLARERLLPAKLGFLTPRTGAPVGGSLAQSAVGLGIIVVTAVGGYSPMGMFYTLAALAAVGIMSLLALNGWASSAYFARRRRGPGGVAALRLLPALGGLGMAAVVVTTVGNLHAMTGAAPGSWQVWLLPGLVATTAFGGLIWGAIVVATRKDIAKRIGRGETEPLAVLDAHLLPYGDRL